AAGLAAFAAGFASFFWRKLMGGTAGVRRLPTLAARDASFLRGKFMRAALGVRRLAALPGDFAALCGVHRSESAAAPTVHGATPQTGGWLLQAHSLSWRSGRLLNLISSPAERPMTALTQCNESAKRQSRANERARTMPALFCLTRSTTLVILLG